MAGKGTIIAVCISSVGNVPKYPQEYVKVGQWGFVGDFHGQEMRISHTTGLLKPNTDKQISLMEEEVLATLNYDLKIALGPGHLAENILTRGVLLKDLEPGALLRIGQGVMLEVTEQNIPCKNINVYHQLLVRTIYRMRGRGVFAVIKEGVGAVLKPGDSIEII
jgi:MOSC domain-containing protein YiiM